MKSLKRVRAFAALIVLSSIASGCDHEASSAPAPPPAPAVTVSQPVRREVVEWDEYIGRLEASETVEVRARISGFLDAVEFQDGQLVEEGQLLFRIDARPFKAEVDRAEAEVARAKARLQNTADELKRLEGMRRTSVATGKEYQDQVYANRAAEAELTAATAALRTAALNLEFTEVLAPIHGRISRKLATPGNLVTGGSQGTLLTTITALDPIHCYVDADERAILKYQRLAREKRRKTAREAEIPAYLALSDEREFAHEGRIDFVDNRLQPGTGTLLARATFDNRDERFTPGLFARLRIPGSTPFQALLVADQAIASDQGQKFVLVVGPDDVVHYRSLKTGSLFDGLRAVEGVGPGDWIVVNGLQRVRPGAKVVPQRAAMPARNGAPTTMPAAVAQMNAPATRPTTGPVAAGEVRP
jgi:membrane fusion protein, multidrug efflux system